LWLGRRAGNGNGKGKNKGEIPGFFAALRMTTILDDSIASAKWL